MLWSFMIFFFTHMHFGLIFFLFLGGSQYSFTDITDGRVVKRGIVFFLFFQG